MIELRVRLTTVFVASFDDLANLGEVVFGHEVNYKSESFVWPGDESSILPWRWNFPRSERKTFFAIKSQEISTSKSKLRFLNRYREFLDVIWIKMMTCCMIQSKIMIASWLDQKSWLDCSFQVKIMTILTSGAKLMSLFHNFRIKISTFPHFLSHFFDFFMIFE